jgi:hypothetical protein
MEIEVQTDVSMPIISVPRTPQPIASFRPALLPAFDVHDPCPSLQPKALMRRPPNSYFTRCTANINSRRPRKTQSQVPCWPTELVRTFHRTHRAKQDSIKLPLLEKTPRRLVRLKKTLEFQYSVIDQLLR